MHRKGISRENLRHCWQNPQWTFSLYKYHNSMIGDFTFLHRKQWASWKSLLGGRRQLPCGDNSEHCLLLMFCLLFPRGETLPLFSFLLLLFFLLFVVCCFLLLVVDISSILSFFLVFYLLLSEVILFVNILLYHLTMWINCADVHVCHCHQLLLYVVVFVVVVVVVIVIAVVKIFDSN